MSEIFVGRVVESKGLRFARALFDKRSEALSDPLPVGTIVRFEDGDVTVLAEADTARARLYRILQDYGIDPIYPPAVRAELIEILANPGLDDLDLEDRTGHAYVTIDNEGSRDLDQALFIERRGEGYCVHYALADAAYFVRPGSALLEESLCRGTSFYLPSFCVPMLPAALSEGLISLNENVERRALVFELELDSEGRSVRTQLLRAKIRSRAKLTYDGVQRYHDEGDSDSLAGQEFTPSLDLLRVVGELRMTLAQERGVVPFNRRSLEVGLDRQGKRFEISVRERNDCERWNEQISLLCNMEGADLFQSGAQLEHVQPVYRVHPPPLTGRRSQLVETIEGIIGLQDLDPKVWRWDSETEGLADYLERLGAKGGNARAQATIQRQILYMNRASEFSAEEGQHYALGVDGYARFSAPMREVVGIFTHKEGLERLGLAKTPGDPEADRVLRQRAIDAGNAAKKTQRKLVKDSNKLAIDQLLETDLQVDPSDRADRPGTIFGLRTSRLYVELDDFPVEIKVYRADLDRAYGCRYEANKEHTVLAPAKGKGPEFRLGDGVRLKTRIHDGETQRWSFVVRPDTEPVGPGM